VFSVPGSGFRKYITDGSIMKHQVLSEDMSIL
jgi:hypothetical protein